MLFDSKNFTWTITRLRVFQRSDHQRKGGVKVERDTILLQWSTNVVSGTLFCGEVLDLDALTGGFNLQIAWSTAYAAGSSIF